MKYIRKPYEVEAMQFDGTPECQKKIQETFSTLHVPHMGIDNRNNSFEWCIKTPKGECFVNKNDWVVKIEEYFIVLDNEEFEKTFQKTDIIMLRTIENAQKLLQACEEFVRKCECGQARSKRSYKEMKDIIKDIYNEKNKD